MADNNLLQQALLERAKREQARRTAQTTGGPTPGTLGEVRAGKASILPGVTDQAQGSKDRAVGAWKKLGQSALSLIKGATSNFPTVGISGVNNNPVVNQTLDKADKALAPTNTNQKVGGYMETALEIAGPVLGSSEAIGKNLIKAAQEVYMSAMKPSTTLSMEERSRIVKTGLDEGIRLTEKGVGKLNGYIDTLETKLGEYITAAGKKGGKIATETLRPMINEAKSLYGNTVNVAESEGAVSKIEQLYNDFVQKYGSHVSVEDAQKLKTNTYKILKNDFGEISGAVKEGMKAMARGLKDGIVREAPQVEGVNARLGKLYEFSDALEKSVKRIGNHDIISLGGKVLMSGEGITSKLFAVASELFKGGGKSTVAILMDSLGKKMTSTEAGEAKKLLEGFASATGVVDLSKLTQSLGSVGGPPKLNKQ